MIQIRIRKAQKGQGLVEYATIISLVAVVSIVILSVIGIAVARNYGVVAAVFGAKKNAASSSVSGLTNTIYVEPNSPQVTCHTAKAGTSACSSNASCGANGMTYVSLTLYASPDILKQDLMFTANSLNSTYPGTGSAATVAVAIPASFSSADPTFCPDSVVVSGKKAIDIAPITATVVDP